MIICYTGKQGSGKTYSAVEMVCKLFLSKGKQVLANLPIEDPVTGARSEEFNPLHEKGMRRLLDARDICIVLDEAPVLFGARDFDKRSTREFFALCAQVRRRHNSVVLTAQSFDDLDVWIRRQCHLVVDCKPFISKPFSKDPSGWVDLWTGKVRGVPLFIRQRPLDPRDAELAEKTRKERHKGSRLRRFRKSYANAFDSWADVSVGAEISSVAELLGTGGGGQRR